MDTAHQFAVFFLAPELPTWEERTEEIETWSMWFLGVKRSDPQEAAGRFKVRRPVMAARRLRRRGV